MTADDTRRDPEPIASAMSADLRELASAPICGHVMATCRNEPGHPGDHWNPSVSVVAGVPDREPVGVEPGQGGPTDGFLDALTAAQDERDRLRREACQHPACTDVYDSDSPASAGVVAIAWALAERSADGPHGSNERRRFRPLARAFLRDLKRDPKRAAAVRAALAPSPKEATDGR